MNRLKNILNPLRAAMTVVEQRGNVHGNHVEVHVRAADMWSAYLQVTIKPRQVAMCMALLKLARNETAPKNNPDNVIDHLGYVAIAADLHDVG